MGEGDNAEGRLPGGPDGRPEGDRVQDVRELAIDKLTEMHADVIRWPEDTRFARYRESYLAVYRQVIGLLRRPRGTVSFALAVCSARLSQLEHMADSFPIDGDEASQVVLGLYGAFRNAATALERWEGLLDLEMCALTMEQRGILDTLLWQETGLTGLLAFDKDGNPIAPPRPPKITPQMLLDGDLE